MEKFKNPKAEILRLKTFYRRLILFGRIKIPRDSARNLLGPDCAFHLYRTESRKGNKVESE
ncbi:MAG: hypothetical protein N2257_06400 [Thermodesulfovibrionales bacterium]|nr:hypothetical protein [Thermodesulfovibrionales bacterium]